ncbi:MAG: alpha/beta hydrolase [Planctomycetaceae bacterium]|nr:alpha/beta hydrolase [Planctomycetaceae bacterium]
MRRPLFLCLFVACVAGLLVAGPIPGAIPGAISTARAADAAASAGALESLRAALGAPGATSESVAQEAWADVPLTKADALAARDLLWEAHRAAHRAACQAEIEARELRDGDLVMPFFLKTFGAKPASGYSLWISLHGGGGAPARVNDQQWENQKKLYKLEEGIYVAPRAPTNTWNLWHEAHIDRLFHRLIEDLVITGEVDPNRVYVLGYSAGGDGVYQLAPRMADHWAAAAMMAGHPNGVSLEPVRNVPFALQVGALDTAYDRAKIGADYGRALEAFHAADPRGYETFVKIHEGKGHWMDRDDAAALPWMAKHARNPVPDRVVWQPSGASRASFSWLALRADAPRAGGIIDARVDGQVIDILRAEGIETLLIRLDDRLIDCDLPVQVRFGDRVLYDGPVTRSIKSLARTLADRGDPELLFPCEIAVAIPASR